MATFSTVLPAQEEAWYHSATQNILKTSGQAANTTFESGPLKDASYIPTNRISSIDETFVIGHQSGDVVKILSFLPVSRSQLNTQQSPIDVANGRVYTTNIEPGLFGDGRGLPQKTVLRQAVQKANGDWHWESTIIDDRTIYDEWHTAPSVAVDKTGRIHVVYNMHNTPWQYKRSAEPHHIYNFDFLGQSLNDEQRRKIVDDNIIDFPTLGLAAIPGNQISYPAFYKDREGDLFVSYRFAATPKKRFSERTMSAGIASYDVNTGQWSSSGANIPLNGEDYEYHQDAGSTSTAIAGKRGWTAYHPRLLFDNNNQMLVSWFWRLGRGGGRLSRPCMVVSADRKYQFHALNGSALNAPVSPDVCGNMGYSNEKEFFTLGTATVDASGVPYILLSPVDESRQILHYDYVNNYWVREIAPHGATEIFFDEENTLWAIASGIRIFKRPQDSQTWLKVYDEGNKVNCLPRVKLDNSKSTAFIHSQQCDGKAITIYALKLK